jgi:hypothetical protein
MRGVFFRQSSLMGQEKPQKTYQSILEDLEGNLSKTLGAK